MSLYYVMAPEDDGYCTTWTKVGCNTCNLHTATARAIRHNGRVHDFNTMQVVFKRDEPPALQPTPLKGREFWAKFNEAQLFRTN